MKDNINKIFTLNNGDHVIVLNYKGSGRCCDHCYFKDTRKNDGHYEGCIDKKRRLFQGVKFPKDTIIYFGLPICGSSMFVKLDSGI